MSTLAELEAVFLGALEHESPGERASFLERACRDQPALRSDVDRVLAAHSRVGDFLEGPTTAVASLADTLVGPAARTQTLDFLSPPDREGALGRLGTYVILEVIGYGGFGVVFKALDEKLQRLVAIKALAAPLAASAVARVRFVREARAVAAINHESVVRLYAVEDADRVPYLVMEYVAGTSLQTRLQTGPLATGEIQRIGMQIAEGLAAAHARGLVHRDIKPANILLEETTGRAKITDFGQARALDDASHSQEGLIAGTPEYMSPEQARGRSADHRSDLFSLGSVLYAMCVGRPAFDALGGALSTLRQICEQEPLPIAACNRAIPDWLVSVIKRLHAKDPSQRFQSAAEVAAALRSGTAPAARAEPPGRRWQTVGVAMAAAAVALLIAWQIVIRIQGPDGQETTIRPQTGAKVIVENGGQPIATVTDGSEPPYRALAGHKGPVWNVAFAGNRVLSCGADQWVRVWDVASGAEVQRFDGHRGFVYGLAVAPDGKRALSSSGCRILSKVEDVTWSVCLWEIETGKELQRLEGRGPGITSVTFSPDGSRALLAGYDGSVRLWDVAAWQEISAFRIPGGAWSAAFSADGQKALTAGGTGNQSIVGLWQLPEGTELKRYDGHKLGSWHAMFLPGGRRMISGGQDDALRLWDADSARQLEVLRHDGQVTRIAVSADGRFAVAGAWVSKEQHSLKLFQLDPPKELHVFRGPWTPLNAVALSPDGRWCLAGGSDGSLRLWRMPKVGAAAP